MVRYYIITETERKIIEAYLKDGTKLPGFRMLKKRVLTLQTYNLFVQAELITRFQNKLLENTKKADKP